MNLHHYLLIAALVVPLSLDTFILAAALGLAGLPKKQQTHTSLVLAAFEAVMPIIGVIVGQSVGTVFNQFAGYTAAVVIGLAGLIMLWPGGNEDKEAARMKLLAHASGLAIIDLGISISLDELAVGFSLGLLGLPLYILVPILALQAFLAARLGLLAGGRLSEEMREQAEMLGGILLIVVAAVIIILKLTGHPL